jgi:hypothetical protein
LRKKDDLDQEALRLIFEAGDDGLLQSDLWKELDVSSREGSRLATRFEEKEKIIREKELCNGRWTYRLYFKREPVTLDSVKGCPCLICSEMDKCFSGGTNDPTICSALTAWIDPRIEVESSQE